MNEEKKKKGKYQTRLIFSIIYKLIYQYIRNHSSDYQRNVD